MELRVMFVSVEHVTNKKTGDVYPVLAMYEDGTISYIACKKCFSGEHVGKQTHFNAKSIYVGDPFYQDAQAECVVRVEGFNVNASTAKHACIPAGKDANTYVSKTMLMVYRPGQIIVA